MRTKVGHNRWFVLFSVFVIAISQLLAFSVLYNSKPASASTNSPLIRPGNSGDSVTWEPTGSQGLI